MGFVKYRKNQNEGLMKSFLASPQLYKQVILSDKQLELYETVKSYKSQGCTSRQIIFDIGGSIQSISTQLYKLWTTGYIERKSKTDPTGGVIYIYRCAI